MGSSSPGYTYVSDNIFGTLAGLEILKGGERTDVSPDVIYRKFA